MEEIRNQAQGEYTEVDRNMIVATSINKSDVKFYDVREAPFEIYGLYDPINQPCFCRTPNISKIFTMYVYK